MVLKIIARQMVLMKMGNQLMVGIIIMLITVVFMLQTVVLSMQMARS